MWHDDDDDKNDEDDHDDEDSTRRAHTDTMTTRTDVRRMAGRNDKHADEMYPAKLESSADDCGKAVVTRT